MPCWHALAATASLFLPAMASAEPDCSTYLDRDGPVLTVDEYVRCLEASAWDVDDDMTFASLIYHAANKGADVAVLDRLAGLDQTLPNIGLAGAIEAPDLNLIDWFLERGADVNGITEVEMARWSYPSPPLARAIESYGGPTQVEVMALLLDHGADPNQFFQPGGYLLSPMHLLNMLSRESIDLLLSHGGDINLRIPYGADEGLTPLHEAVWTSVDEKVVYHILSKGADPLASMANGLRPIDADAHPKFDADPETLEIVRAAAGIRPEIKSKTWFAELCQSELSSVDRKHLEDDPIGVEGFCECAAEEAVLLEEIWTERGRVEPTKKDYDRMHEAALGNGAMICGIRYGE